MRAIFIWRFLFFSFFQSTPTYRNEHFYMYFLHSTTVYILLYQILSKCCCLNCLEHILVIQYNSLYIFSCWHVQETISVNKIKRRRGEGKGKLIKCFSLLSLAVIVLELVSDSLHYEITRLTGNGWMSVVIGDCSSFWQLPQ